MSVSATYNWAYKPGVTNKYGLTVPAGADNVKPTGWCYVALFGNDATGNGSRELPYRTITKAVVSGGGPIVVVGSGVYRAESSLSSGTTMVGDGDVTIDCFGAVNPNFIVGKNIKIKNVQIDNFIGCYQECSIEGNAIETATVTANAGSVCANTLYKNLGTLTINFAGIMQSGFGFNTFVNIGALRIQSGANSGMLWFSIYENCKISFESTPNIDYCLFHNCQFRIGSSGGYTAISDLAALRAFIVAGYPGSVACTNSIFADPLFNNPAIGDYGLAFNSPAKNASYYGTYIGAHSITQSIKVSSTESTGGFEFDSAVNLTIADDSLTLTDTTLDAQIDTKVIVNLLGRELAKLPSYGFNADRNGQYIDSIADLSALTYAAGDALPSPMAFLVEVGAIVYNGATYQPGERGTTVSAATTFSTVSGGVMREITEAPQRHTIMARFSDGGATVTVGDALTAGYYYYVSAGTVTYDSTDYNAGDIFKAVDTNAFSGSGTVMLAFSTEDYQHYEPGIRPTSNNVGDARTGAIARGNGDPAYVRGGVGVQEFPINAKFIQIRYIIRVTNLKP